MKLALRIAALGSILIFIAGCGNNTMGPTAGTGYGPFDSRGNYVEAWADNPSKWKGGNTSPLQVAEPSPSAVETTPLVAKNELPPPDSVPVQSAPVTTPKVLKNSELAEVTRKDTRKDTKLASSVKNSKALAKNRENAPKTRPLKSELAKARLAANDKYDRNEAERKSARKSAEVSSDRGLARKAVVSKSLVKTESSKSEKARLVAAAKAKSDGAKEVYVVKKGDTLSKIASRNNTTVAALQKENKISGSVIQPGKKLVVAKN